MNLEIKPLSFLIGFLCYFISEFILFLNVYRNTSMKFVENLKLKMPEIVYVYSQNSAINFLNLIKNYHLDKLWMNTNLMCIGEKTSVILNEIKWRKIFLFNPGEEEFLLYKI